MIASSTQQGLRVSTDGTAGSYIVLPQTQVDEVRRAFDERRIRYWVEENAISWNGGPYICVINLGREGDAEAAQAILDHIPSEIIHMDIKRNASRPSNKGPADWFTGSVRIDPLFDSPDPGRAVGASVTFEPGARTAWHTHPLGQTLIVTAGCGWAQRQGGPREEIRPGDVVWFPPGEKHWHGASPTTAMTHLAIQEKLDGKTAEWMEKVTDEQ